MVVMVIALQACGGADGDSIDDILSPLYGPKLPENAPDCSCEELDEQLEAVTTRNGEKYTGTCFANYPNTDIRYEQKTFRNGALMEIRYLAKDGSTLTVNYYKDGKDIDRFITCECSELEIADNTARFEGEYFTGECVFILPKYEIHLSQRTIQVWFETWKKHYLRQERRRVRGEDLHFWRVEPSRRSGKRQRRRVRCWKKSNNVLRYCAMEALSSILQKLFGELDVMLQTQKQ